MKTKTMFSVFVAFVVIIGLASSTGTVFADPLCDPAYVTQAGNVFTVQPNGTDDTANLQCAFDAAVAYGAGAKVQLGTGTFHTAQIVVNDFQGTFTGAGMQKSVIVNLPNLYVTPEDMYFNPPSAANPWPSLFAFVDGDFIVSDLTIHISGDNGTTGWSIFGIEPPITELALGIVILGNHADARFEYVLVEGEPAENSLLGYNLINGIFYEGFIGEYPLPISGSFQVSNSIFRHVGSGTPVTNMSNARVVISHNKFEEVFLGMDGGDFINSTLEFSHNNVNAVIGFDLYNIYAAEDIGSSFLIKNNVFRGEIGPAFEQVFGEGNECLLLGNNVQGVTDIGIYLGPGTTGCTVVGSGANTNVLDLGTDNILTGVNNMGVGIGPDISSLLSKKH